jgi:hypothetical protein
MKNPTLNKNLLSESYFRIKLVLKKFAEFLSLIANSLFTASKPTPKSAFKLIPDFPIQPHVLKDWPIQKPGFLSVKMIF